MLFNNPLSIEKADRIIDVINLGAGSRVVDLGCGEGAFLARVRRASGADCLGVDIDPAVIEAARARYEQELGDSFRFLQADAATSPLPKASFDLAESLGYIAWYATTSNQDEWDHFEWSFRAKAERRALVEPENQETVRKRDKVREWNRYYRRFGRSTMGFGFYLFRRPET